MSNIETCLGHLTPRKIECEECKEDEFNQNCPQYIPLRTFEVEGERDKGRGKYSDEELGMWY